MICRYGNDTLKLLFTSTILSKVVSLGICAILTQNIQLSLSLLSMEDFFPVAAVKIFSLWLVPSKLIMIHF
jgi:hypothetical protein